MSNCVKGNGLSSCDDSNTICITAKVARFIYVRFNDLFIFKRSIIAFLSKQASKVSDLHNQFNVNPSISCL